VDSSAARPWHWRNAPACEDEHLAKRPTLTAQHIGAMDAAFLRTAPTGNVTLAQFTIWYDVVDIAYSGLDPAFNVQFRYLYYMSRYICVNACTTGFAARTSKWKS